MEAWFGFIGFIVGSIVTIIIFRIERKDKLKLSAQERKDRFKLVAIEKRLEAHQKVYSLCTNLLELLSSDDESNAAEIFKSGKLLMTEYALYLENGTRLKLVESLGFVNAYLSKKRYLSEFEPSERKKAIEIFHKESQKIFELARIVQKEVELEPIKLLEDIELNNH